ncbi:MAG: ABC transporter permease [Dehalococcoidia bacterium]
MRGVSRGANRVYRRLTRNSSIVLAFVLAFVMFVGTSLAASGFASGSNIRYLLVAATFIGVVGLGQTFVVLGGGVDLSIPYTLTAVALLTSYWSKGQDAGLWWMIPVALALAALIGVANGIGVALLGVSPIIMTLGMNVIVEGGLLAYLNGQEVGTAPPFLNAVTQGSVGPVPIPVLIWLGLAAVATVVLTTMTYGRRLYAVGTNRTVAELSGIRSSTVLLAPYVVSALTAGVAGLLLTGYTGQAYLGMGDPYLFASVAAVAVGGASLLGGSGHYIGTIGGALVLTVLAGLLPVLNVSLGWVDIIYGGMILITVFLASVRKGRDET